MGHAFSNRVVTIVLAGGQGTRLFPLTERRCKPAVAFGGHYRLIDIPLSNSLNAELSHLFVISQYFASDLHQHILSTYPIELFREGRLELLTPQETPAGKHWFKGTADAVRQNLEWILKCPGDYFLILSGDQLYNMDLLQMLSVAEQQDADLVIAALPVDEPEAKRMGLLQVGKDNQIGQFHEKPKEREILDRYKMASGHYLASMGIYVFKRKVLVDLLKESGDDFGHHLIPHCIQHNRSFAYLYEGYWEDIGTVSSYYTANLLLTEKKGLDLYQDSQRIYSHPHNVPSTLIHGTRIDRSLISQGAIIDASEITRSIIGLRSRIQKGTIIRDSIINGHQHYHPFLEKTAANQSLYSIGQDCQIERAIIDEDVYIGDRVKLINKQRLPHYDGEGIYIRDGIIVVTSGTELPDGFVL